MVIGGGVLGAFHAYHAAKHGLKVQLIEKDTRPVGASARNFGQVVPSGFAFDHWHYYGRYGTEVYREWAQIMDFPVTQNGSIYLASTEGEMRVLEEARERFAAIDYPSNLLGREEVLGRYPAVRKEYVYGALFFPQEVSVNPPLLLGRFHDMLAEQLGVDIYCGIAATGLAMSDAECTVSLADGRKLYSDQCIICNGSDFGVLLPDCFVNAPIEVVKLQMLRTRPLPSLALPGNILTGLSIRRYESFRACDSHALLDPEEVRPGLIDNGIHILFKQEADGSVIIGDSHHYADLHERDSLNYEDSWKVNGLIVAEAERIVQLPSNALSHSWSGYYSQMKHGGDIYAHNLDDRVYIRTAIGGKGMTASAGYADQQIASIFNKTALSKYPDAIRS